MIQVRDEIECGEVEDENGLRWKKFRPWPVRIVIADEAETRGKLVRLMASERTAIFCLLAFAAAAFVFSAACWYFLLTWLKA